MEKQPGSKNVSRHGHQHNFSPTLELETAAQGRGFQQVAGVDEAGRGPLAGPVMVAAVILGKDWNAEHPLNDSKKLSSTKREQLFDVICSEALAFKIVSISAEEIDRLNILQATLHGMLRCLTEIEPAPDYALVDGNRFPQTTILGEAVVKGDARSKSIAAASILAKVTRDRLMMDLAKQYPGFGWERNFGYGTAEHRDSLAELGPNAMHRSSFAPIRKSKAVM